MKTIRLFLPALLLAFALTSCGSDDAASSVDDIKPVISMNISGGFPVSCTTVQRGSVIPFKALFTDNQALGGYSISIHNNFDHHSHDTEVDQCAFDPEKTAVNPWVLTRTYTIPAGSKEFTAEEQLFVPNDIDTGDYHFMVQLTDAQGWATLRGISIKIVE